MCETIQGLHQSIISIEGNDEGDDAQFAEINYNEKSRQGGVRKFTIDQEQLKEEFS